MGVTAPLGFRAAAVAAGLKPGDQLDVAVVVNDGPHPASAAVLTRNRVHAAPVAWTRRVISEGTVTSVVLNSGGANACTGEGGYADTVATAELVSSRLGVSASRVAVCSTGLIGERLPMNKLSAGVVQACQSMSAESGLAAADAIRTTDTVSKTAQRVAGGVTVGAMAKGAGMLAPGLATMLAVITTDAVTDSATLDRVLRQATALTFDRVDSDGCMSTNDSVIAMASGASGVVVGDDLSEPDFEQLVVDVCADLARQLVRDAEGASKDIRIDVTRAATQDEAVSVGRAIARSNLFKCAIHGEDPNWGRVLSAVGTTEAEFDPDDLAVAINGVWVAEKGQAAADRALVDLRGRDVVVTVDLGAGAAAASIWTNDLTAAYVHENSAYSS
ncbi:MAG TPA: bifunctional glutamate N-acetyltransferase/amino-acid acetyltransferase ArgJ [Actinomycetes bacterium]|nr:bifunctional glutamate N-acetyltransferase/amino-acid acetyltransferase ArgJ [Actinomycetes bacterium]